jgi:ATP-dependent Lhr-like helicase
MRTEGDNSPKELLPHTFDAFLSRFGRLTEIQKLSLELLLEGKNCVLAAATASGKTEAALAPILERYQKQRFKSAAKHQTNSAKFLYLVPTKALARDIARRIEQPLNKLAISWAVKTGDEPSLKSSKPPTFVITTPESLDSILANRPKILRDVQAVVLDELHLYDNTPRGDQLRILLNRLRRLRKYAFTKGDATTHEIHFCALSATLYNPAEVAERYFANPVLIQTAGTRAIEAELYEMQDVVSVQEAMRTFQKREIKKVLAFCQSRAECEEFVNLLRGSLPFGEKVFVHHANLSASVRHQTEEKFAQTGAALCFATSTLELGIDIGDVDLVMLLGAPDNLGSFLQRIGRGNRRTNRTQVACFYRSAIEEAVFRVYLRAAKNCDEETNELLRAESGAEFRPSVVVQQLCSYLKQTTYRELDPEHAYGLLATPDGTPLIDKVQYDKIVRHLIEKDFFRPAPHGGQQLQAGKLWEKLDEERKIYSNLSGTNESAVIIDNLTGRTVGFLETKVPVGQTFLIGGEPRQVTAIKGRKVFTRDGTKAKLYHPRQKYRWRVKSAVLTRALAKEMGFPMTDQNGRLPLVTIQTEEDAEQRRLLFHHSGEIKGFLLSELLAIEKNILIADYNEFYVEIADDFAETELNFSTEAVSRVLHKNWKKFESAFDLGSFQNYLPTEVRRNSVIQKVNPVGFKVVLQQVD